MVHVEIGERVEVDLFGLMMTGRVPRDARATGTVVGFGPGTITIRLELEGRPPPEVTVSPGRIFR